MLGLAQDRLEVESMEWNNKLSSEVLISWPRRRPSLFKCQPVPLLLNIEHFFSRHLFQ